MYSNDQIIFKRFLEYNNIHQIYISNYTFTNSEYNE